MSSTDPQTLGQRIAHERTRRGLKQKQLAEAAGMSVTFLSEVENDRRMPGSDSLLRLADALDASLDYLVRGEQETARPQEPLVLPTALTSAANLANWTFGATEDLLKLYRMRVARRSPEGSVEKAVDALTSAEWRELYERFFGDRRGSDTR